MKSKIFMVYVLAIVQWMNAVPNKRQAYQIWEAVPGLTISQLLDALHWMVEQRILLCHQNGVKGREFDPHSTWFEYELASDFETTLSRFLVNWLAS